MISQHPVDGTLLHRQLDSCREQLTDVGLRAKLRTVLADFGYVSEENFTRAEQHKLRLLAPLTKDPNSSRVSGPAPPTARSRSDVRAC